MEAVGPFLRYERIVGDGRVWTGSVLIVTPATAAEPAITIEKQHHENIPEYEPVELNKPVKLDTFGTWTFWRFDLTLDMDETKDTWFRYHLHDKPGLVHRFVIAPYTAKHWHWAFTSCNGFSLAVPDEKRVEMGGLPAMWHDMLRLHRNEKPFHLIVGGGDQVYSDLVWRLPLLKEWLSLKGRQVRTDYPWSEALEEQVQQFYLENYIQHFVNSGYGEAVACIPAINMLDDHDMWDGMGSYPSYLETSMIFSNLRRIAYKYYMLFQHHQTSEIADKLDHFIGRERGSYSIIVQIGTEAALCLLDARGERTTDRILSQSSWNDIFDSLNALPNTVQHLVMVTGVPIIYPRMQTADSLLSTLGKTKRNVNKGFNKVYSLFGVVIGKLFGRQARRGFSRTMESMKTGLGKSGMMSSLLNHFGEPELLDDLIDHWTHENHTQERLDLVERLQKFSLDKNVRVTFLSGDVHCAGAGKFYNSADELSLDQRLMFQIISSAIGNIPPPKSVINALHRNAHIFRLNESTSEQMLDVFQKDIDDKKLIRKKLMGRRNWCNVSTNGTILQFSIQVENVDWRAPSVPYTIDVPSL